MPQLSKPLLPSPIRVLLLPGFTLLSLASLIEPLRIANRYLNPGYVWTLCSIDGAPVPDANGIDIPVDGSLLETQKLGTLIVVADREPQLYASRELLAFIRKIVRHGTVVAGIDTGAHILALAGLLDGYRATAHWEIVPGLQECFSEPDISCNIYEMDRDRITSAGGTAVIDLMLHIIKADHGQHVAVRVSEHCLHDHIRQKTNVQQNDVTVRYSVTNPKLSRAIKMMEGNLATALPLEVICAQTELSMRQMLRLFQNTLGTSPSHFYMHLRLEKARRLLQRTDLAITEVALTCGFRSHSHFSRVFRDHFGLPPNADRREWGGHSGLKVNALKAK